MEHLHYNDRLEHLVFFDYDQSGRQGHLKKLFKRRSRLDIRKCAFSNRIIDRWNLAQALCCVLPLLTKHICVTRLLNTTTRWNSFSESYVTCGSINCFKSHISSKLEPETTWNVYILESGLYMALSMCPLSHQCAGTGCLQ